MKLVETTECLRETENKSIKTLNLDTQSLCIQEFSGCIKKSTLSSIQFDAIRLCSILPLFCVIVNVVKVVVGCEN